MRKRVKKQLREQEKGRYKDALDKIHQLEVETANFLRAISISEGESKRLKTMFEQLQAEYEELETSSERTAKIRIATAKERDATINRLTKTIDELKRPWWRKWWYRLKSGMAPAIEGKKGSYIG